MQVNPPTPHINDPLQAAGPMVSACHTLELYLKLLDLPVRSFFCSFGLVKLLVLLDTPWPAC